MVAWSGTPVLCTLFQQPLLVSFVDQYVCFNNEVHLNLSEINFLLAISNQVNQSNHKMCVVNFSEQRALVSNSYLPSPKPGESHPIFKSHTKPFHANHFFVSETMSGYCFGFCSQCLCTLGHVQPLRCVGDFQI